MTNEQMKFNTKKKLSDALKKKMHKKAFSDITATEIIRDCNLNRNTFYYHFSNMGDLLKWTLEQDALNVVAEMDLINDTEGAIRFILDYIDKNKFTISCAYDSLGKDHLKQFFFTDIKAIVDANLNKLEKNSKVPMSDGERELFSMFFTEGVSGILLDYADNPKSKSKEDIVSVTCHLLAHLKVFITG